jgi:hypothetical protein
MPPSRELYLIPVGGKEPTSRFEGSELAAKMAALQAHVAND